MKCCFCGKEIEGYGNNPHPVGGYIGQGGGADDRCCDECNSRIVIPVRLSEMGFRKSVIEYVKGELEEIKEEK